MTQAGMVRSRLASLPDHRVTLCALAVFLVAFLVFNHMGSRFFETGVSTQYNTIFDADPACRLSGMADGWCNLGNRELRHPNFANIFGTFSRAVAAVTSRVLPVKDEDVRMFMARHYLPIFGALQSMAFFFIGFLLSGRLATGVATGLLNTVLFTNLLFSSLPEHFGISSSVIAWGLLMGIIEVKRDRPLSPYLWIGLGAFGMAVTITNLYFVGLSYFVSRCIIQRKLVTVLRNGIAIALTCIAINAVLSAGLNLMYHESPVPKLLPTTVELNAERSKLGSLQKFALASSNAIAAAKPDTTPDHDSIENGARYTFRFTYDSKKNLETAFESPRVYINLLALIIGAFAMARGSNVQRFAAGVAGLLLASNLLLHTFWGTEMVLYASDWLTALMIFLFGISQIKYGKFLFPLLILYVAVNNLLILKGMFALFV